MSIQFSPSSFSTSSSSSSSSSSSITIADTSRFPLLQDQNVLTEAILDIIDGIPTPQGVGMKQKIAKIACLLFSAGAKVPYIKVGLQVPKVGPEAVAFNCFAFFILEVNSGFQFIDNAITTPSENEGRLLARGSQQQCSTPITIVSIVTSLLSQVPTALAAYYYNDPNYKIPATIGSDFSGAFFPALSVQKSLQAFLKLQSYTAFEKKLHSIRMDMIGLIQEHRALFIQMGFDNKLIFISEFDSLRTIHAAKEKNNKFIHKLLSKPDAALLLEPPTSAATFKNKIFHYGSQIAGGVLTATLQTALCWYTFVNTRAISNENGLPSLFTVTTYLTNAYLMTTTLLSTTSAVVNFMRGKPQSIADTLRPKLCFALKGTGLILDILALGPTWKIWGDFDKEQAGGSVYFEASMMASIFLLLYSSTLCMIDDCVEYLIKNKGSGSEKEVLKLDSEFRKVTFLLDQSSLLDFCYFYSDCGSDIQELFRDRHDLTAENLQDYLNNGTTDLRIEVESKQPEKLALK